MKERDENELVGYEIKPGKETLNPIGTLTKHVCLNCLQPTDKKIREIKRKEIHPFNHTSCDRCFLEFLKKKKNNYIFEFADSHEMKVYKRLIAFYRRKKVRE